MASTIQTLNIGELGNTGIVNAKIAQAAINDITALQTRVSTAESGLSGETNTRATADTAEATARIGSDQSLRAALESGDAIQAQARANDVTRLDQRIDGITQTVVVGSAPLTTTTVAASAGANTLQVASISGLLQNQAISIRNAAIAGPDGVHATTLSVAPTGTTLTLVDPLPAAWTASNQLASGSVVGTSPPEIAAARDPFFRPASYRGNVPARFDILERKRIYVRSYRLDAGGDEGAAINMALAVAPAGYTVAAEPGIYTINYLTRPTLVGGRKLLLGDGVALRPQYLTTTLAEAAPAGQTFVKLTSPTGFVAGVRISFLLDNGQRHWATINTPITGNSVSIQPGIPSGRSAANGATVRQWWGSGLIRAENVSNIEIEGGYIDGLRGSTPNARMLGLDMRGVVNARIDGLYVGNIASNQVDGINNWGNAGDAFYWGQATGGAICRNITVNDAVIENCDRSAHAAVAIDGLYVNGGSITNVKPTDGSTGNLGVAVVFEANSANVRNRGIIKGVDISECYHGLMSVGTANYDSGTDTYNIEDRSVDVIFDGNTLRGQIGPDIMLRSFRVKALNNTIYLGSSNAIVAWTARDYEIAYNTIIGSNTADTRNGVHISGATEGTIHHNTFWRTWSAAIAIDQRNQMKGVPYIENISITFNRFINCVNQASNVNGVIVVQTGLIDRTTDTKAPDGSVAGGNIIQTTVATLTVAYNMAKDDRTGGSRANYGMYVANTSAGDRSTWDISHNRFRNVEIAAYQGMVIKNRDMPAQNATVSFSAPANGVATAIGTVQMLGVEPGDPVEVRPLSGTPPTGYARPEAFVTASDTISIRYPVLSGQSPATLNNQSLRLTAVKYT